MTVFECKVLGGKLRENSDETSDARFVAADELASYQTSGSVRGILPSLYDCAQAPHFEPPSWQPPVTP